VWLVPPPEGPAEGANAVLREAARLAAPQMLRRRLATDVERRAHGESLRLLFEGAPAADVFAAQLGVPANASCTVVAYALRREDPHGLSVLGSRASDLLTMHFRSFRRDAHVVPQGDRVYALLWEAGAAERSALLHVVNESVQALERTLKVELCAAVGSTVAGVDRIPDGRRTADEALRVAWTRPHERAVDIEQVRGVSLVIELREQVADSGRPLSLQLQRLLEQDADHRTQYVRTLRTHFDTFGNSSLTSELLHIHPNTLRYRLRRICDLAGVDLDRADERFALECELRLMLDARPEAGGASVGGA
jgi:sugar diacid utilization regulator